MAFQFNEGCQGACHPRQLWHLADRVTWPTADGGLLEGAQDTLDAEVIPAIGWILRPLAADGGRRLRRWRAAAVGRRGLWRCRCRWYRRRHAPDQWRGAWRGRRLQ